MLDSKIHEIERKHGVRVCCDAQPDNPLRASFALGKRTIQSRFGDVLNERSDAIVNAANEVLTPSLPVCLALSVFHIYALHPQHVCLCDRICDTLAVLHRPLQTPRAQSGVERAWTGSQHTVASP
jgi:hypothetical protein